MPLRAATAADEFTSQETEHSCPLPRMKRPSEFTHVLRDSACPTFDCKPCNLPPDRRVIDLLRGKNNMQH